MVISQRINFYQDSFRKAVVALPLKKLVLVWGAIVVLLVLDSVFEFMSISKERFHTR